jgi:hypothetical protein
MSQDRKYAHSPAASRDHISHFDIDEESAPNYHEGVRLVTLRPTAEIADATQGVRDDWAADHGAISAGKRAYSRERVGLFRQFDRYWNVCMANVDQHANMATSVTLPGEHTDPIANGSLLVSEVSLCFLFVIWTVTLPYCFAYALYTRDRQVAHLIRRTIELDLSVVQRCCTSSTIREAVDVWAGSGATKAEVAMGPVGVVISPVWSTGHRVYVMGVPRRPAHVDYYRSLRDDPSLTKACVLEILANAGRTKVVTHYTSSEFDTVMCWLMVNVCPALVTILLAMSIIMIGINGTRGDVAVIMASIAIAIAVVSAVIPATMSSATTADAREVAKGRIAWTWKSLDRNFAETHPVNVIRQAAHITQSLAYGQRHSYTGLGTNLLRSIPGEPTGESYSCNAGLALSAVCSSVPSEVTQYATIIDLGSHKISINTTSGVVARKAPGAVTFRAGDELWIN